MERLSPRTEKKKKSGGKVGLKILAIVALLAIAVLPTHKPMDAETDSTKEPTQNNYLAGAEVSVDDARKDGLDEILELIGIDARDADNIEQIDDWYNGSRYSFNTNGTTARVYYNMDGSIESIRVGVDIDLYKRGYEPYQIGDFMADESTKAFLQSCAEEAVSACLNYPSTVKYPLLDWSFGRDHDLYSLSSHVTAKNAFGVENEMPFQAKFYETGETIRLIYLTVDGSVVKDDMDSVQIPEREQVGVESDAQSEADGEIRLIDERLGEFGEKVRLDGYEYIWYHVPAGTYTAVCNSRTCVVYVDKNQTTKNSSGYIEMQNAHTVELNYAESKEITVRDDEHIFLTIYADVTLAPTD